MAIIEIKSTDIIRDSRADINDNFSYLDTNKLENIESESVGDLSNVSLSSPTVDQLLKYDGTNFVNATLTTDEVSEGSNLYFTNARAVSAIKADTDWNADNWDTAYGWGDHSAEGYLKNIESESVGNLSDVDLTGIDNGKILKYNGTSGAWEIADDNDTTYEAGTGIGLTGTIFSTNDSEIDHNSLSNYAVGEHRTINDAGTSVTDLWSADKINTELGTKADSTDLNDYQPTSEKNQASGYAGLDANTKIPESLLPSIAITETYSVADITERDALTVQEGDIAIVTDASSDPNVDSGGASYIYDGTDWQRLKIPNDAVQSVNGQTGVVSLDTDNIGEGSTNLYFTDARAVSAIKSDADWNATNWDTAYGWGDHSAVGYLTTISGEVIGSLSNVDETGKASGKILKYNGTNWVVADDNDTTYASSDFNLADLGDVTNTAKAENKILKVDATGDHVYEDDNDTTYTAGDGLTLSGTEFANDDKGSDTYNVDTTTSSATPTPTGNYRQNDYYLTALATDPTFSAPSGTASLGNTLYIEITASGATRILSWNAVYTAGNTHSLPTSLADGATVRCGFKYDGSNWILIALDE